MTRHCVRCQAPFVPWATTTSQKFCSQDCSKAARKDAAKIGLAARFWAKVEKTDGCWEWTGARSNGYGQFSVNSKPAWAHRVAYELTYGAIPDGLLVCHHCDNGRCVRPDHFFLGSIKDNAVDMANKLRGTIGPRNRHCRITAQQAVAVRITYRTARGDLSRVAREIGISMDHAKAIGRGVFWKHV